MRWLVDECVSARLVSRLRAAGYDVEYVLEVAPGADDRDIIARANRGGRILLTDDKDFGELVMRQKYCLPALVLMRTGNDDYMQAWRRLEAVIARFGNGLLGRYTVIEPARFRSRKLWMDDETA